MKKEPEKRERLRSNKVWLGLGEDEDDNEKTGKKEERALLYISISILCLYNDKISMQTSSDIIYNFYNFFFSLKIEKSITISYFIR